MSAALTTRERAAVARFLALVGRHVPARLAQALLFGSKARGTARPDSDVDLLLIFDVLPPDREPQATMVEEIAERVSAESGVPLGPWSVARIDLARGMRTPMLVDALDDGITIWPAGLPSPCPPFTPDDALRCTGALLDRVEEGSDEAAWKRGAGDAAGALRRGRDDVVRLCTAALLLHGETRPRRARCVERFVESYVDTGKFPPRHRAQLAWAIASFGPGGRDEDRPLPPAPGGFDAVAELVDALRRRVDSERERMRRRIERGWNPAASEVYELRDASAGEQRSNGAGVARSQTRRR